MNEDAVVAFCLEMAEFAMLQMTSAPRGQQNARNKADVADWVTDVDVRIEEHVRNSIRARFPDHRIVGEEQGTSGDEGAGCTWYMDPIDGTCNYVGGLPWSSFSLALFDEEGPVVGVVADPYRHEVMHAVRARGAWCNLVPLPTLDHNLPSLEGGIVMLELANERHWPGMDGCMSWLEEHRVTARIMGSSALSVCSAAAQRASATVLGGSNPIDVGAAVLIARECGLLVLGRDGSSDGWPHGGLIAGPSGIAKTLYTVAFAPR